MPQGRRFNRRQFLRIVATAGAGAVVLKGGWQIVGPGAQVATETRLLMGTVVNLTAVSETGRDPLLAIRACFDRMSALEAMLSRFKPQSEVSRLNSRGRIEDASEPLLALLEHSYAISEQSNGAFDITVKPLLDLYAQQAQRGSVPSSRAVREAMRRVDFRRIVHNGKRVAFSRAGMQITLDGIAKGYIVDAGVAELRKRGLDNVLIEAGGDLMAAGRRSAGEDWEVGVESPRARHPSFMTKSRLANRAMATSGDYMQTFTRDREEYHILDPRHGHSPRVLASATVTAPTTMLADALATTLMVLGPREGLQVIDRMPGCEALLVTRDLRTMTSRGFPG